MRPIFQPLMVNEPFGDPVLYVDFLFARRALLFDAGDLRALPTRKLLRVSDVFLSHAHMDHFEDFDRLVRFMLGRGKWVRVYGPQGIAERLMHKLAAYDWNLVHNYEEDVSFEVFELCAPDELVRTVMRCRNRFEPEPGGSRETAGGLLREEPEFRVRAAILDHGIPSLGFALEETLHVNVWKNHLQELGLSVGPWLHELKQMVLEGKPDDTPVQAPEGRFTLGEMRRKVLQVVPGTKLAYLVDVGWTPDNVPRVLELIDGADLLFIETAFLESDLEHGRRKLHLTARQAGELARRAGVKRVVPIHFSPRYTGREAELHAELHAAWQPAQQGVA
ncbi:MAG: MBL fold metallo-hydrolase [Gammaproteobacteria bacterium]|jgi:ribonuclease Z